jgi:hypothetical protein
MIAGRTMLLPVTVALGLMGCGAPASYSTVDELLNGLQAKGLQFDERGPVPMPQGRHFRFDEGLRVSGADLWVELIRIDDPKVFDIAKSASALLVIAEASAGRELPGKPEIHTRQPFLVVVRQEPTPGHVSAILNAVLPQR